MLSTVRRGGGRTESALAVGSKDQPNQNQAAKVLNVVTAGGGAAGRYDGG